MKRPWRRAVRLLGLLIVSAALFHVVRAEVQFRADLRRARAAVAGARFDEAHRLLHRHPARLRADPEVAYLLGLCEHARGRPGAALEAWSRVPLDSPRGLMVALLRAKVLVGDFGRFADAEPLLRWSMSAAGPAGVEARHALFQLYFIQGRAPEMRTLILGAWSGLPDRAPELRDFWRIENAQADLDAIRQAVAAAEPLAPDDDRVWLAGAYLATLEGRRDEARHRIEKCLGKRPRDPAVWEAWLRWARSAGSEEEAIRAMRHIPANRFTRAEILELRAWVAACRGDRPRERRSLEELVALQPGHTQGLGRLAALASQSGQDERSKAYRRRLTAMMRDKTRYREILESPGPITEFLELARLAETLGHRFEACGWWTLAVERQPSDLQRRARLARILSQRPPAPLPPMRCLRTRSMPNEIQAATRPMIRRREPA